MLLTAIFHQRPNPAASMASSESMSGPMAALNMNPTPRFIVSNPHLEHDFRPVYLEGVSDEQDQPAPSWNESFSVPGTDSLQSRRPLYLPVCLHLSACHLPLHLHPLSHLLHPQRLTKGLKKRLRKRLQRKGQTES
ncbi:hypothetical protein INT47_010361 [Mucor saturninus]|uniref:Uncharacterized protein n=1 Tax=Mucor saturninus TaxID=64648 RepID=A0A8H7QDP3_9FUNG|nr:hypothetical protein INT47_010361 [Mucor saturninus]